MTRHRHTERLIFAALVLLPTLAHAEGEFCDEAETHELTAVVRDFLRVHPDFENNRFIHSDRLCKGLVQPTLTSGKPRLADTHGDCPGPSITGHQSFDAWFNDVSGINATSRIPITMRRAPGDLARFTFESDEFFPIDDDLMGNEGLSHNYHFTAEIKAAFTYQGGEQFTFAGDDDVWVFINDRLALDMGGVHISKEETVSLDEVATELGLEIGQVYDFAFFFAERHTSRSVFHIDTSIDLRSVYYRDSDEDGFGDPGNTIESCSPPPGYVRVAGDCNDINATIHPGAQEVCDGRDNDCSGVADGRMIARYGEGGYKFLVAEEAPQGWDENAFDDSAWAQAEGPVGHGQWCGRGGQGWEGESQLFVRHAFWVPAETHTIKGQFKFDNAIAGAWLNGQPIEGFAYNWSCNLTDTRAYTLDRRHFRRGQYNTLAVQVLDDASYLSENSSTDDTNHYDHQIAAMLLRVVFFDWDGDGFGDDNRVGAACTHSPMWTDIAGDCDDSSRQTHPGAIEVCDNADNDCDGSTDEFITRSCEMGCGASFQSCRDGVWLPCSDPAAMPEVCDGYDNDCDGIADDDQEVCGDSSICYCQVEGCGCVPI